TAFKQQRLKAWQPILTPRTVLPTFFLIGVIFVPLGGVFLSVSNQVQELSFDYTMCSSAPATLTNVQGMDPIQAWSFDSSSRTCTVQFKVDQTVKAPVYLYYRLSNFYQNHRRYVKSLSAKQLKGDAIYNKDDLQDCAPLNGADSGLIYYPCGLIANSLFNDTIGRPSNDWTTFSIQDSSSRNYNFVAKDITWPSDAAKYGPTSYDPARVSPPKDWIGGTYRNKTIKETWAASGFIFNPSDDQQFQVWMRTAGLPNFRKLYAKNSDADLAAGTYTMRIVDNFPVDSFGGTKGIVISESSWLGGKNPFLGIMYLVVGLVCIILGAAFLAKHLVSPR
ncbi:hypothetical protein MP638_003575, partial [Amoeboaphelidium occidentale]